MEENMTYRKTEYSSDKMLFDWIGANLPSASTGMCVSDLDLIIYNWKSKRLMLLEVKRKRRDLKKFQRHSFRQLDSYIRKGIESDPTWKYEGFHLLQFENTSFQDGKVYFDKEEVSEAELISILSL